MTRFIRDRTEDYVSIIAAIMKAEFAAKRSSITGLHKLCNDVRFATLRNPVLLELLERYPAMAPNCFKQVVGALLQDDDARNSLRGLADGTLAASGQVRGENRALWMSLALVLNSNLYREKAKKYLSSRVANGATMSLVDLLEDVLNLVPIGPTGMSVEVTTQILTLVGSHHPYMMYRAGAGNSRNYDASECVLKMIRRIAADASSDARACLKSLCDDSRLESYRNPLLHAISEQDVVRRADLYTQPTWMETIAALENGKPANHEDLFALAVDHLRDLALQIRYDNSDMYKDFWNLDGYGRPETTRPEDSCRDRLMTALRSRFRPLGITIQPEAHMAVDKRADMEFIVSPDMTLPVEVKKDSHDELWTAWDTQLHDLYMTAPSAAGYGVYLIFWFGNSRDGSLTKHPEPEKGRPTNPLELQELLVELIPIDLRKQLQVVVVDLSKPV